MIGFTSKLKQRIAELEAKAVEDAEKSKTLATNYNTQVSIRDGEIFVLKTQISKAYEEVKVKDGQIILDEIEINFLHETNNNLIADKRDMEKSLSNLQNVIKEKDTVIKRLDLKIIELRNPKKVVAPKNKKETPAKKKKRKPSAKLLAYYNRGDKDRLNIALAKQA